MKQVLFLLSLNVVNLDYMKKTDSTAVQTDNITYPYTPAYTSNFDIGNPAHSKTILDLAKDWDNNALDNSSRLFADTVTLFTADGTMMQGPRDSIIAATKPYRNSLGTVSTKVHAWTPLKAVDKDENWVLIWSTEYHTAPDGKKDSAQLQETWRLNKEGKADMLLQYMRKNPTAKN